LSDEEVGDMDLDLNQIQSFGETDGIIDVSRTSVQTLIGRKAANACYKLGSEPGFFQINDDGNEDDELGMD